MNSARNALLRLACVVCFATSGAMLGFALGRIVGPFILGPGAGMADLGYMFTGAVLGSIGGLTYGVREACSRAPRLAHAVLAFLAGALLLLAIFAVSRLAPHLG